MPPKAADPKAKAKGAPKKKVEKKEDEEESTRVPAPDRAAHEAELAEIQKAIDGFQKQQAQLATRIAERSGGKEDFFAKKAEFRAKLDEFSGKINELVEQKNGIQKQIGDKKAEALEMKQSLGKMQKKIGYTDEKEIDDRIASIEFKMWTESNSLKAEKEMLKEIAELKKNRPKVSQMANMSDALKQRDFGGDHRQNITQINEELALYRDGKRKVQEEMTKLMDERKEQLGDLPKIIEERDAIGKQIAEKVKERNELRDAFRQKEREFNAAIAEQRKIRAEKFAEERAARQAEYDKTRRIRQAEKLDEQPHLQEMTLIEQSILFCKSLTQTKEAEEKKEQREIQHDLKDGMEVLSKKEDRDEFYFVPTAKKKGKSKNKGGKEGGSSRPIKHNAETFRLFDQLKLDAPITTDDVPATLEKLEAQLEMYKEKVKEWEANRDEMKRKILEGVAEEPKEEAAEEGKEAKGEEDKPAENAAED